MNYEFKGTPGPWQVCEETDYVSSTMWSEMADCVSISPSYGGMPRSAKFWDVNKHLIASAPDLFEALKETVTDLKIMKDNIDDAAKRDIRFNGYSQSIQIWIDRAEAALQKALNINQ